jgi:PBP1b-binding outer membrane lipoprotein LpoB
LIYRINFILSILLLFVLFVGCSDNNPTSPFANYNPEIVNNTDSFEFQISDGTNVTAVVEYSWQNTGTQASIDHSSVFTDGVASITILDADDTQVYSSVLLASSTEQSTVGVAGTWTIIVVFANADGTANFRVESM